MSLGSRRSAVTLATGLLLAAWALSGCSSTGAEDAAAPAPSAAPSAEPYADPSPTPAADQQPTPTIVTEAQPDALPGDDPAPDRGQPDGGSDPAQDAVRTGPVAQYGGPAYGDQGEAEIVEPGVWCKTIAVFWGGSDPIPEGVAFTFEQAVADRPGLAVEAGVCGSSADRPCIGTVVVANASGIFCSLLLRPGPEFADGTAITFTGSLTCASATDCDLVASREVEPGPPIIVNTPEGA
jgi:hypothetical protein